jgi:hypothetical protein
VAQAAGGVLVIPVIGEAGVSEVVALHF